MTKVNFEQILDEIQQQKLQISERVAAANTKITEYTSSIQTLQEETAELQTQLSGLEQLLNRTQLLANQ